MLSDTQALAILADISVLQALQQAHKDNSNEIGFVKIPASDLFEAEVTWYNTDGMDKYLPIEKIEQEINTYRKALTRDSDRLFTTELEPHDHFLRFRGIPRIWGWDHAWAAFHVDPTLAGLYPEFLPNAIASDNQRLPRHWALYPAAEFCLSSNSDNQLSVA